MALELLNNISKLALLWSKSKFATLKTNQHLIISNLLISDIIFAVADKGQLPPLRPHLSAAGGHLLPREEQPWFYEMDGMAIWIGSQSGAR